MKRLGWPALLWMLLSLAACGGLGGEPEIVATVQMAPAARAIASINDAWRPDIENGARIFAERCVECHGTSGDGQGDLVLAGSVERPLDMTDREQVAAKSPLAWFEIITRGKIENLMPPWAGALSEAERWDVALYAYTLAYDDALLALGERLWRETCGDCALPALIPPVYSDADYGALLNADHFGAALTDAEAAAAMAYARMTSLALDGGRRAAGASAQLGMISGVVVHGTAGGALPGDTTVQLRYGNIDEGFSFAETTIDSDGGFQFNDIPLADKFEYMLGAVYDERLFNRRASVAALRQEADALRLTVYDETNDPFVLSVAGIDLFIEPLRLDDLGAGLAITQILTYHNNSDRLYTSGRGFDDGREAALLIQSPQGALLLSGDGGGRYVVIEDMERLPDSVIDTLPVMPGEGHRLLLEYWLPYAGAAIFEQAFSNSLDAALTLTLSDGLEAEGEGLRQQETIDGARVYEAALQMERDPQLRFGINGDPFALSSDEGLIITSDALPLLLLGVAAVAAALFLGFGLLKRRGAESAGEIDRLVGELVRLEADHDQGRINHDLYHHRRRELKARLAELMASDE